jgi:2',5'-phosphodiesterase
MLAYQADVLCLQEVDESVFYGLLEPVLTSKQYNYQGYYLGKVSGGTREGCAMFWSLDTFANVPESDQKRFALQDLLVDNDASAHQDELSREWNECMKDLSTLLERRPDLRDICTNNLGHVIQMVPLTTIRRGGSNLASSRPIWMVNTHLFFHPRASHIRLLQMFLLARQLGRELDSKPGEVVVCGDFNSSLRNAAGKLLLDRSVPRNYHDNKTHLNNFLWDYDAEITTPELDLDDDFPAVSLPDSFPTFLPALDSTPPFTHFVAGFQGALDHVLITDALRCRSSAPMPTVEDVTVATAMPSANLPSDHVSLVCDLVF